ncbi:MAG: hypothetical protein CVU69_05320 [Deltaproteobacteria bacterium HGW-Deltaproteobacteria-4]|nr:MAG: hypothetical protein CVU69_05320 [Deltaproteobacteria bacterium HGW-Deltaproteobacteria-4]
MNRWRLTLLSLSICVTVILISHILPPVAAAAMPVEIQSTTLFRLFQRDNLTNKDESVAPVYEYLQADIGQYNTKGLSLHLYGWGRTDLARNDYYEDNSTAELLYGYLEYTRPFSNLNLRLGRQQIVAGIANDSIDGLSLFTNLGDKFSLSAYGGFPVAFSTIQGRSGDYIYGGRIAHHLNSRYAIGLSYQQLSNDGDKQNQQLGIDTAFKLPAGISLSGRSSYNLENDGWGEHFYEVPVTLGDFSIRPFFEKYDYRDYFAYGNRTPNPFSILTQSNEGLTTYGTDILWGKTSKWDIGAKVKHFTYHVNDDTATYYAGLVTWHGAALTQIGGELGTMQGDAAKNNYLLSRLFFYWDRPNERLGSFVSGDLVYALYDESIYGKDSSFFASLGAGQRFFKDRLELKLSGDYSVDPNFDSDFRGMLVMNYRFGL